MLLRNYIGYLRSTILYLKGTYTKYHVLFLVLNASILASKIYMRSYDALTHLFFAHHYIRDWFNIWEYKWYGGFMVTSYPPFVHQILALLMSVFGLEYSFGVLAILTLVLAAYALKIFAENVFNFNSKLIMPMALLNPTLYLFLYVFGQLPTVFASVLSLLASSYMAVYIREGSKYYLAVSSLLASLAIMSHHVTSLFFLPITTLLALCNVVLKSKERRKVVFKFLFFTSLCLLISLPIALMMYYSITSTPMQTPIPHGSRDNIFSNIVYSGVFFWSTYGPLAFMFSIVYYVLLRRNIIYAIVLTVLVVFGLGGATPIPKIFLGQTLYSILTFDKFSLWSSLLMLVPLAYYLEEELSRHAKKKSKIALVAVISSFILAIVLIFLFLTLVYPLQPPRPNIEAVAKYLNEKKGPGFYVTIDMGTWFKELSIRTEKPTLDGGYNTARKIKLLVKSGVESIDSALFFPNGTFLIREILTNPDKYGIRWVITVGEKLRGNLFSKEFTLAKEIPGETYVRIWENKEGYEESFYKLFKVRRENSYIWGLEPITVGILTLILVLHRCLRK